MPESLGKAVFELVVDSSKLEGGLNSAKAKTEGWASSISGVAKGAAIAMSAAFVGVAGTLVAFAESTAHTADSIRKLARETGLTAEEASKLRFVAEKLGIDSDGLSKSFGIFSKGLENNSKAMQDNHVQIIKNASGHIDLEATLGKLADRFQSMPDGVEKTGMALEIFGKSGKDMIPLLNQGSDGLKNMGDEATKMGLVFSKEGVESAKKFGLAQKELGERFEGMKNTVGMAVLPTLTKFFDFLSEIADKVLPPITKLFGNLVDILGEVFGVITGQAPDAGGALKDAIGEGPAKIIMGALGGIRDTVKEVMEKVGSAIQFLKDHWDVAGPAIAAMALFVIVPAMVAWGIAAVTAATATILALLPILVPIALIGAAVALLVAAWNSNFGDIQGKTKAAVNFIQDVFDGFRIAALLIWRGILTGIAGIVNGVIGVINGFVEAYDNVAKELSLPILGKIDLITPNLSDIDAAINKVARDREARLDVYEHFHPASHNATPTALGTDHITRGPELLLVGEAGPEHVQVTPLAHGTGEMGGGGAADHDHTIIINLDGRQIAKVVGDRFMRGAALAGRSIG